MTSFIRIPIVRLVRAPWATTVIDRLVARIEALAGRAEMFGPPLDEGCVLVYGRDGSISVLSDASRRILTLVAVRNSELNHHSGRSSWPVLPRCDDGESLVIETAFVLSPETGDLQSVTFEELERRVEFLERHWRPRSRLPPLGEDRRGGQAIRIIENCNSRIRSGFEKFTAWISAVSVRARIVPEYLLMHWGRDRNVDISMRFESVTLYISEFPTRLLFVPGFIRRCWEGDVNGRRWVDRAHILDLVGLEIVMDDVGRENEPPESPMRGLGGSSGSGLGETRSLILLAEDADSVGSVEGRRGHDHDD